MAASNPFQPPDDTPAGNENSRSVKLEFGHELEHDLETIQFVRHAIRLASRDPDLNIDGRANAVAICRVVLELAADLYGKAGKEYLQESHLHHSEIVGIVVRRLVAAGIETQVICEPSSAFEGLYDLARPPESWALKWNDE